MAARIRMPCPQASCCNDGSPARFTLAYAADSARWRFGLDSRRLTRCGGRELGRTRLATSIVVHLALSTVCMATRLRKSWSPGVNARRTSAGGPVSPREQKRGVTAHWQESEISGLGRDAFAGGDSALCDALVIRT